MDLVTQAQIAKNLKELRGAFNYTQEYISEIIHISGSTYALYETGRKVPSTDLLLDLCDLYRISMDMIIHLDWDSFDTYLNVSVLCKTEAERLLVLFQEMSPFAKGCLMERAETLLEKDSIFNRDILTRKPKASCG